MKRCLLFLLFVFRAFAAEDESEVFSLVNQSRSAIPRIAGSVNVITGNWVDQAVHHETTGPDPYVVGHSYISSSLEEGTLADGWDFFHPSEFEVFQPRGITYNKKGVGPELCLEKGHSHPPPNPILDNHATLFYREAGGSTVVFMLTDFGLTLRPCLDKTGYTILGSIDAPVRRDHHNTKIHWNSASDNWIVTLGDGCRRIYSRTDKHKHRPRPDQKRNYKRAYHIKDEILPSGNRRHYHYNSSQELKTITTLSSDEKLTIHSVSFHREKDEIEVSTSDGLKTRFSLRKLHDRETAYVVDKITCSGKEKISYSYSDKSSRHDRRVDERRSATGRTDVAKFYREGKNEVGKDIVHVSDKKENEFLKDRVREIWTKAFSADALSVSHAFTYKKGDRYSSATVLDSGGASTYFLWDKEKRPHWITIKDPSGNQLTGERFVWSEQGRLLRRTIFVDRYTPLLDRECVYDTNCNVIQETLKGSFSGRPHTRLTLDKNKNALDGETLTWKASYSDDGRSLKTAEVDPMGNWTYYEYEPNRQLLTARFACHLDQIIRREFFSYDAAGSCIESMSDDGSSRVKDDCANVTRRSIMRTKYRQHAPFYGAPREERSLVWTPQSGEQLVRIERYVRDEMGRALAKERVDASGVVQKRWTYAYDEFHRVVESIDPSGHVEKVDYDDAGRVFRRFSPEVTTTFSYDLLGRILEERRTFPDGSTDSLCTQYDLTGRVVTRTDGRGRQTTTMADSAGRHVRTILPALSTDEGVVRSQISVNYSGSTERRASPTGAVTEITRSATGKPLVTKGPSGVELFCFYDARNRLVEQTDSSGLTTRYEYDALDRPTRVEQSANGCISSVVAKIYLGFDLIEERHSTQSIHYGYDSIGRKIRESVTDLLTNQTVTTRIAYDTLDRPIRIFHDDFGTEEILSYDGMDREIERRLVGSDGTLLSVTTKGYDRAGRLIEEGVGRAGTIATTTTTYGAYGLISSITCPDGTSGSISYNPLYTWTDGHTYFQKITVDARGVVTEQLLDSNDEPRVTIVRDPFGAILSSRVVTFSLLGKPVLIEDAVIVSGKETSTVKTRLTYDASGQCTSCTLAADTSDAATWVYRYDAQGRKIEEIKPSGTSLASSYDAKGRLVSFKSSDGTIDWKYRYNAQDLPEVVSDDVAGQTTVRSYDGMGHLVQETLQSGLTFSCEIQASGLLTSITYPDASQSKYSYRFGFLSSIDRNGCSYCVNTRDISGVMTSAVLPGSAGLVTQAVDSMGRRTQIDHEAFAEHRTVFDPVGCCLERTIDGRHEVFTYDYLCQLTNDAGRESSYDSLHRRLATEGKVAVHNARHQILEQGDRHFSFDIDGRRTSDDQWTYRYDACDRLIAVEDATKKYEYTYDPFSRRLSSTSYSKDDVGWKCDSTERFLWQGECEVGSVDADGTMLSLRVLGEGLGAEIGAAVLCEKEGSLYVPLHDLSGHVRVCLSLTGDVLEKLSYTAFGLESRTGETTPWTFSSKRQDSTGFCYFGRRFYEPETATWLTQDPLGTSAGPNLYAYVRNNPLTCSDLFGLFGQDNDRGFWGGLWDSLCGMVSNFVGGLFGGGDCCDNSSFAQAPSDASDSSVAASSDAARSIHLRDGREIFPDVHYRTQVCVFPYGGVSEFVAANKGLNLKNSVIATIPGMGVSFYESCERADRIIKESNGRISSVAILYNSNQSLTDDLIEALLNTAGFELTVGATLKSEFFGLLDACRENNISFTMDFICHSQGVAIGACLFASPEFSATGCYAKFIGTKGNFGGPKIVLGTMNYVAIGDPVSLLALLNLPLVVNALCRGELRFVLPTTFEFPHNFDGSAYQSAISEFLRGR